MYSLLSAPTDDTPRLVELALLQGSAGQRMAKGLAKYYKKVRLVLSGFVFFLYVVLWHSIRPTTAG